MTIRAAVLALVLFAVALGAGCCCMNPWGNAASWSFATKRPQEKDLAGAYRVQAFLSGDLWGHQWPKSRLVLTPDGSATLTSCPSWDWLHDSPRGDQRELDATGTWSVVATKDGYFEVVILLNSGEHAGQTINLTVWHNSPKHKLWTQIEDPDQGDGVRFDPVETTQMPKSDFPTTP